MAETTKEIMTENNIDITLLGESVRGLVSLAPTAQLLANADIIPDTFKKKAANVLIALNMAQRMHAEPLALMQNMYIVYGKPSFSSKFLIGCFNNCGRYTSIKYRFVGERGTDNWGCEAYASEVATGQDVVGPLVTIKMSKDEGWYSKNGSKWKTMPELMMRYRSAAFLINTTAPEISLGLMTQEEIEDTIDIQTLRDGSFGLEEQAAETEKLIAETPVTVVDMSAPVAVVSQPVSEAVVPAPAPKIEKRTPSF